MSNGGNATAEVFYKFLADTDFIDAIGFAFAKDASDSAINRGSV